MFLVNILPAADVFCEKINHSWHKVQMMPEIVMSGNALLAVKEKGDLLQQLSGFFPQSFQRNMQQKLVR